MYINPRTAIENGWISHPDLINPEDWEKYLQPNALDFSLDALYKINHHNLFVISEEGKTMRGGSKMEPIVDRASDCQLWFLNPKTCYDGMSNFYVDIPEGVACELIIRSTFNRNGIFLTSGIYDSLFSGNIGFAIHNNSGAAKIAVGTRIGQIKFLSSDSNGGYEGQYNTEKGQHWSEPSPV